MYFITTKRMLEVCFFQHTPTFIIEPLFLLYREHERKISAGCNTLNFTEALVFFNP